MPTKLSKRLVSTAPKNDFIAFIKIPVPRASILNMWASCLSSSKTYLSGYRSVFTEKEIQAAIVESLFALHRYTKYIAKLRVSVGSAEKMKAAEDEIADVLDDKRKAVSGASDVLIDILTVCFIYQAAIGGRTQRLLCQNPFVFKDYQSILTMAFNIAVSDKLVFHSSSTFSQRGASKKGYIRQATASMSTLVAMCLGYLTLNKFTLKKIFALVEENVERFLLSEPHPLNMITNYSFFEDEDLNEN